MSKPLFLRGLSGWVLLFVVYFLVAAASFGGYFTKWAFLDGADPRATLPAILDGTAHRPFVYRQLIPSTANFVEHALPERVKQPLAAKLLERDTLQKFFSKATDSSDPRYVLRYYMVYYLVFVSLLLALFAIRAVCLELLKDEAAATLAPLVIAMIIPLMETNYGVFYDMPELLFMALATWLALRARFVWLIPLVAVATFNKEAFPFFVLALFPFIRQRLSRNATLGMLALLFFVGGIVNVLVKLRYAGNPGGPVEFHLFDHLRFLMDPRSYFQFEFNYSVLTTKGLNVFNILVVALLFNRAWGTLSAAVRQHILIALAINLPLFLAFCMSDEMRNLSFLYVGFSIVICVNISTYLAGAHQRQAIAVPALKAKLEKERDLQASRA